MGAPSPLAACQVGCKTKAQASETVWSRLGAVPQSYKVHDWTSLPHSAARKIK